jgi:hypothetical protein
MQYRYYNMIPPFAINSNTMVVAGFMYTCYILTN